MKRILAVKPGTDDITLSIVEGTQDSPKVKAVKPQKGFVSHERVKNEAAVQLAASSLNVNAKLIAPQSIRAAEKKEEDVEKIFDCKFKSKDKKEVAFLGYMGLKD